VETGDLSLFLAITRMKSISRTAEQLFMSQSTATTRLQRLERRLGYALFERLPNGVKLTADGERMLPLAESIVHLEDQMTQLNRSHTPILRVMSGRAFVSTDVPECLTRMMKKHNVHLQVRMGLYEEMMDALLTEQVDFCFLGEPIYHPSIEQVEFGRDAIDLIVPVTHHFVHDFPGIRALQGEPFIAFSRETAPLRRRITTLLAQENVYPHVRMELDSIDGIKAMVSRGLGVSLLPRRTLHDADAKRYSVIRMRNPEWTRPTLLAFPKVTRLRPFAETFIEVTRQYYKEIEQQRTV